MLDHGDGNLWGEIPNGTPGGVGIDVVVVAHRLATELFGMCEAILVQRIKIQSCLLMRILTITQHMGPIPGTGEGCRELELIHRSLILCDRLFDGSRLRPMLGGPFVDGRIISSGMCKRLAGKPTTLFKREALAVCDASGYQSVILRIGDNGDGGAVFGGAAHHGGAADIDFLDGGGFIGSGAHGVAERIQVHHHQIEGLDAEPFQLGRMVGIGHVCEDAGMNMRIEGLDTTVEAFRKTGDLGYLGHLDTQLGKTLGGGTGGDHLGTCLDERLGEYLDAFLMEDGYQSPSYRSIRCCHPAPPCC